MNGLNLYLENGSYAEAFVKQPLQRLEWTILSHYLHI